MNERITELKDLHVKSKPELQTFLRNTNDAINRRSVPHLIKISYGVQDVVKGYDFVIDELFREIDRLLQREEQEQSQAFWTREGLIEKLQQERDNAIEGLQWYADPAQYDIDHLDKHGYIIIDNDGGEKARTILSELGVKI